MSTVKKVIAAITAVIGKVSTDLPTGCRLFVFLCEFTGGKNCDDRREPLSHEVSVTSLLLH